MTHQLRREIFLIGAVRGLNPVILAEAAARVLSLSFPPFFCFLRQPVCKTKLNQPVYFVGADYILKKLNYLPTEVIIASSLRVFTLLG